MNISKTKIISFFICSCIFVIVMGQEAYAYIDPGTGSFLLQFLIGGIAAVFITTKMYWQQLKKFFTGNKQQIDNEHKPTSVVEENQSINDK